MTSRDELLEAIDRLARAAGERDLTRVEKRRDEISLARQLLAPAATDLAVDHDGNTTTTRGAPSWRTSTAERQRREMSAPDSRTTPRSRADLKSADNGDLVPVLVEAAEQLGPCPAAEHTIDARGRRNG